MSGPSTTEVATYILDWDAGLLWRTYISTQPGGGRLPHPQERTITGAHLASRRRIGRKPRSACVFSLMCCGRRSNGGKAAPGSVTARTLLDEIGRIQSTDVVLLLAEDPTRKLRIRCVVRPDKSQAMLLDLLGLRLP